MTQPRVILEGREELGQRLGMLLGVLNEGRMKKLTVSYNGILPDLFREGQGIIAHGQLGDDGVFVADEVLAKHDENYMPPEVAESLAKHAAAQEAALEAEKE